MGNFANATNPATRKELCLGLSGACAIFGGRPVFSQTADGTADAPATPFDFRTN